MKSRIAHVCVVAVMGLIAVTAVQALPPTPPRPNPLAGPTKAVADAKIKVDQARAGILVIRRRVAISFEAKPDFKAARELADRSKSEYDAAGRKLIATLEKSPAFVALVTKRDKAQAVVDSVSVKTAGSEDAVKVTQEDVNNAVTARQTAVLAMRKMEKEVQEGDANYAALKQKAADADAAWKVLELQVDDAVKLDPAYPAANQVLETAEANYKQATDQLKAAQKAQADAASRSKAPPRPR